MYIANSVDKANYLVFSTLLCIIILAPSPNEDVSNDFCSTTAKTFNSGRDKYPLLWNKGCYIDQS